MLNGLKSGGVREQLTLDDPNVYKVTATMRHFALVLDVTKDEVHYFADGELVGTISGKGSKWEGWMKEVDCQEITAESYVGFAGRAPGVFGPAGLLAMLVLEFAIYHLIMQNLAIQHALCSIYYALMSLPAQ